MQEKTVCLIDGTALCYRSFYALRLTNSKGFPTGAVYGFYNTLKKISKKFAPEYLAVCFDVSRKTFRQEKYEDYKIQRPPVPDDLLSQIPLIRELVKALGITIVEKKGYEADDVIAVLARGAVRDKASVIIVSSDKDLLQLLQYPQVLVYDPAKDSLWGDEEFRIKFGFAPVNILDFLALTGDSADNVPGAKGIGKKGAEKLIKEYGNISGLYDNLDRLKPRLRDLLISQKEQVEMSRELISLADPKLSLTWKRCKPAEPDYPSLQNIFSRCEFRSFLKELPSDRGQETAVLAEGLPEKVLDFFREKQKCFFSWDSNGFYVQGSGPGSVYRVGEKEKKAILSDPEIKLIGYSFKKFMAEDNYEHIWDKPGFDVKLAAYLLNPGLSDFSLENICAHFLNVFYKEIPAQNAPDLLARLYPLFKKQLKTENLENLFYDIEMPLISVLAEMERSGIKINKKYLTGFSTEIERKVTMVSEDIYKNAGQRFNLNSPKQLSKVLFQDLRLPPVKKTKTGFSTNEEVLRKLAEDYKIASLLLEYRELNKLYSTYLKPFLSQAEQSGSKVHACFHQTKTLTGRLSSSSPNLQNIPSKKGFALKFRKGFVPSFNNGMILSCDYSQVELRVLAHFSGDKNLIRAFKQDRDIHTFTASLLFDKKESEVSQEEREIAKRVNFGIVYGMSPFGLARELELSYERAAEFIAHYFHRYPGVKKYMDRIISQAEAKGYVRTFSGRIRYLEGLNSERQDIMDFSRRAAINTPIQGSAADLIKIAMLKVSRAMKKENFKSRLIIQIHDELVFDVKEDELSGISKLACREMEQAVVFKVPLKVNMKAGKNWGELKDL